MTRPAFLRPRVLALTAAVLLVSDLAVAQLGPPQRASANGMFGRRSSGAPSSRLDLSAALYAGYDADVLTGLSGRGSLRPRSTTGSVLTGGSATLLFQRPGQRTNFDLSGRAAVNHTPGFAFTSTSYAARTSVSHELRRTTQLTIAGLFEYAPRYGFATRVFQDVDSSGLPPLDNGIQDLDPLAFQSFSQLGRIRVNQELTRRSALDFGYSFRNTDFTEVPRDLKTHRASAVYRYQLARQTSLRLGYEYTQSIHERAGLPSARHGSHALVLDLGYGDQTTFALSRRTTFGFGFGTALTQREVAPVSGGSVSGPISTTRFHLTGSSFLAHELGRSWTTRLDYRRAVRFIEGLTDPAIFDTVTASIGGLLSRRIDVGGFARYGVGATTTASQRQFSTASASAQIRFAISPSVSLFSQYFYNLYDSTLALDPLLGSRTSFARHGGRIGLNLWFGLV